MSGEEIYGIIMMMGCGFGCGSLFYGLGVWSEKRKDPMHFWSGSTVDPKTISDVPAYNKANGRMWKTFSISFLLTGIVGLLSLINMRFSVLSAVFMGIGCTFGIGWLIFKYKRICRQYKIN